MKRVFQFVLASLVISLFATSIHGQGIVPPQEGNAVVYFTRVSSYGGGAVFKFFHQDKFFGYSKGQNYLRYECKAGQQLFWASSENKEFLTADLAEGGVYIVIIDVVMGFWKGHVGLTPISVNDYEKLERAINLINRKTPLVASQKRVEKENKKLKEFISREMQHYYQETRDKYNFRHISPDMAIPAEALR